MKLHEFRLTYQGVMQKLVIGFSASLCLASLAQAAGVNAAKDNLSSALSPSNSILIAQETYVCPEGSGGSLFVTAETPRYLVYICGGDNPNTYVGISKNGGNGINVPLRSYTRDRFVAVNGTTTYTLTRTQLTVTQNGRVILRERARWR